MVRQITTTVSTLKDILNFCFQVNNYQKPDCLKDFLVASLLMQSKINVIVLLAGTSGTGKSTLASLLGTWLGIWLAGDLAVDRAGGLAGDLAGDLARDLAGDLDVDLAGDLDGDHAERESTLLGISASIGE